MFTQEIQPELKYWTCSQLDRKCKNDPTANKVRRLKIQLNWFAKTALKGKSVRFWLLKDFTNAVMTIATYNGYQNSTTKQMIGLLHQILDVKRIRTVQRGLPIFKTNLRRFFKFRKFEKPKVATLKQAGYLPIEIRRAMMQKMWTTKPYHKKRKNERTSRTSSRSMAGPSQEIVTSESFPPFVCIKLKLIIISCQTNILKIHQYPELLQVPSK